MVNNYNNFQYRNKDIQYIRIVHMLRMMLNNSSTQEF